MLRIQVVNLKKILEDVLQVVQVDVPCAFCDALVNFDDVVDSLDVVMLEKFTHVDVCVIKLSLEVLMRVLKQVVHVKVLLVRIVLFTDHPTDGFIDQ